MKRAAFVWMSIAVALAVVGATVAVWKTSGGQRSWFIIAAFVDLNLLALAVPGYFVTRRVLELIGERRRLVAGSRFKTRLVATMAVLVSGPVIVVFLLSSRFVTDTVDRWFGQEVGKPLRSAVEVGRFLYESERQRVLSEAIWRAANPMAPARDMGTGSVQRYTAPPADDPLVEKAFQGTAETEIVPRPGGAEVIRAAAPGIGQGGAVMEVVVVRSVIPAAQVSYLTEIRESYENRKQVASVRGPVKAWYIILLALFTALTLFLAIGAGLFLSKGITEPIQSLIDGTERVARGELDVKVAAPTDNEMRLLTESFNRMVEEIEANRGKLETAYREAHSRRLFMEAIIQNINTGVIFLDREGQVDTINNAACTILDISPKDLLDITVRKILDRVDSAELRDLLHGLREHAFRDRHEQIRAVIQGRPVVLSVYLSNLRDAEGNPTGVLVVFEDLTDLIKAQRAYAWQEVARRMTHEIKNPLTPIKLSAERLQKKFESGSEDFARVFPDAMKTVIREVNYLRSLVNEFSRLGKLPDLRVREDNPVALIAELAELYREPQAPLSVEIEVPEHLPMVQWDRDQVHRALINLVDNAIGAVNREGNVAVRTQVPEGREEIVITVEDDGPGIPPEDRDRLFNPHFSRKKEGTGLGLAIVHKIVTDHRGTISVENRSPRGTRFVLSFPLKNA